MNVNNPAVKRIMGELKELTKGARPDDFFVAAPMEDNLFEWHFTIRGPPGTAFDGGRYHGRITLPPEFEDRAKVKELVDQLMGRNPEHRFNFIQNNAGDMDREMIDA